MYRVRRTDGRHHQRGNGKKHSGRHRHGYVFRPVKKSFWWCERCGVPLLGPVCGVCGGMGKELPVTPPGDLRPCMGDTYSILESLLLRHFGVNIDLSPYFILLNKIAGEDRTDEVYVNGEMFGIMRYSILHGEMEFLPSGRGAAALLPVSSKNVIELPRLSGHMKGKFVESPDAPPEGVAVLFRSGSKVGWGQSSVKNGVSGIRVRGIGSWKWDWGAKASMEDAVKANERYLDSIENMAIREMRSVVPTDEPVNVAFSGGKDSLAVLLLGMKAFKGRDMPIIFNNTGLEFSATVSYVKELAEKLDMELLVANAGDRFWDAVNKLGPPAKDFRWCCKVCKLSPISRLIKEKYPHGCWTLDGRRGYESFSRSKTKVVQQDPFIPSQKVVCPIRNWSALEVWLYIHRSEMPYNPIYDRDVQRVGCFMCPSSMMSELDLASDIEPEGQRRWQAVLERWGSENNVPDIVIKRGYWRWANPPPKVLRELESMGIPGDITARPSQKDEGKIHRKKNGAVIQVNDIRPDNFHELLSFVATDGESQPSMSKDGARLTAKGGSVFLGTNGNIRVEGPDAAVQSVAGSVMRWLDCVGCGLCQSACPKGAIEIIGRRAVISDVSCVQCGVCASVCPITHYLDKLFLTDPKKSDS